VAGRAEVPAWGTGSPKREFLHVDELADACAFLLKLANPPDLINIGTGTDVTIRELTEIVAEVTGFKGKITWDATKPDGTPRKLMDVSKLTALGWKARVGVREGVAQTYASFLAEQAAGKLRS
jgi:GDP-L-fucose synthase